MGTYILQRDGENMCILKDYTRVDAQLKKEEIALELAKAELVTQYPKLRVDSKGCVVLSAEAKGEWQRLTDKLDASYRTLYCYTIGEREELRGRIHELAVELPEQGGVYLAECLQDIKGELRLIEMEVV